MTGPQGAPDARAAAVERVRLPCPVARPVRAAETDAASRAGCEATLRAAAEDVAPGTAFATFFGEDDARRLTGAAKACAPDSATGSAASAKVGTAEG